MDMHKMNCVPPEVTNDSLTSCLKKSMVVAIKLTVDGKLLN